MAWQPLFTCLLTALFRGREAIVLFAAGRAFLYVISALAVSHKLHNRSVASGYQVVSPGSIRVLPSESFALARHRE
jgi:hypothetical protein